MATEIVNPDPLNTLVRVSPSAQKLSEKIASNSKILSVDEVNLFVSQEAYRLFDEFMRANPEYKFQTPFEKPFAITKIQQYILWALLAPKIVDRIVEDPIEFNAPPHPSLAFTQIAQAFTQRIKISLFCFLNDHPKDPEDLKLQPVKSALEGKLYPDASAMDNSMLGHSFPRIFVRGSMGGHTAAQTMNLLAQVVQSVVRRDVKSRSVDPKELTQVYREAFPVLMRMVMTRIDTIGVLVGKKPEAFVDKFFANDDGNPIKISNIGDARMETSPRKKMETAGTRMGCPFRADLGIQRIFDYYSGLVEAAYASTGR